MLYLASRSHVDIWDAAVCTSNNLLAKAAAGPFVPNLTKRNSTDGPHARHQAEGRAHGSEGAP